MLFIVQSSILTYVYLENSDSERKETKIYQYIFDN